MGNFGNKVKTRLPSLVTEVASVMAPMLQVVKLGGLLAASTPVSRQRT